MREFNSPRVWLHLFFIVMAWIAFGCGYDEENVSGNFYPLSLRSESYQRYIAAGDNHEFKLYDTISVFVRGDTLVDGRKYSVIANSLGAKRLVRKHGSQYFARDFLGYTETMGDEYMFLNSSFPVGMSWTSHEEDPGKRTTKFTILEKNSVVVLFGRKFEDVIVVEEIYSREPGERLTGYRYYQNGVGEISAYLPYPFSGNYGNTTDLIIK